MKNHCIRIVALLVLMASSLAQAQTLCIWDPLGAQGEISNLMKDYAVAALRWNISFTTKVFSDEAESIHAFNNGECSLLNMIGTRARTYNLFTGSIDIPGGLDNYAQLRKLLALLATNAANKYMVSGPYETVGIIPMGAVYPVVNDRSISSITGTKGKRIAVMDWDKAQSVFAEMVGATPVPMNMIDFGKRFNAGDVDVIPAPMILYKALELNKGIGNRGGIIRRPILQSTMQIIARRKEFPPTFGSSSRQYMYPQIDHALATIRNLEVDVPNTAWIYVPTRDVRSFDAILDSASVALSTSGFFDKHMLTLVRRIRCLDLTVNDTDCTDIK